MYRLVVIVSQMGVSATETDLSSSAMSRMFFLLELAALSLAVFLMCARSALDAFSAYTRISCLGQPGAMSSDHGRNLLDRDLC